MAKAIMIRVQPEQFDEWRAEHDGHKEARKDFGMTDGPVYFDEQDRNTVLVTLYVEDIARAKEWFRSEAFKNAAQRSGKVSREIWFAEEANR